MTALELAERLRKREVSSVELVQDYIAKIRERDNELGAFVEVATRRALMQARRADALRARGATAPFLGVPTAIKDHEPVRGLGTRIGSRAFRWLVSPIDGYVARACRRINLRDPWPCVPRSRVARPMQPVRHDLGPCPGACRRACVWTKRRVRATPGHGIRPA